MSAPENSNSKTPPSLLSDVQQPAGGKQSARILANLEGRVAPVADAPRRSKAPLAALIALAVVAVGGWGIWHSQQSSERPTIVTAAAPAQQTRTTAAAPSPSSAAPAAPQPATIVNDDSAAKSASAPVADNDRLSRALANNAVDVASSAPVATTTKAEAPKKAKQLAATSNKSATKAEAARKQRTQQTELAQAQARKRHNSTARQATTKDADPDADLLAVLVARTKPANPPKQPAEAPVPAKSASNATLAARVKDCSTHGFFEDQLCRWRVCDGHWGTDPACPNAQKQAQQP